MKNEDPRAGEAEPRTQAEKQAKPQAEEPKAKPRYEFKILPVDPKNSFDFEDVADK